jgi:type II secretory pathway component GspD/PulD (secretin)
MKSITTFFLFSAFIFFSVASLASVEFVPDEPAEVKPAAEAAAEQEQTSDENPIPGRIQTRTFKLSHVSAVEIAEKFNNMWNGEFGQVWKVSKMAVPFEASNMIMVTAPIPILQACEKAIKELDVEIPQVYVEARFVELENNVQRDLGIDWSMLGGMRGSVQLGGGLKSRRLGRGITDYKMPAEDSTGTYTVSGKDGDITYFNGTLNFNELYLVLHALEANEDAKIFSNPKIIVTSGKKATVDMTTKYPNVKISAKRTVTGTDNTSVDLDMQMADIPGEDKMMFAKESFFSWGISLEVIPRISTNGLINVSIVPTISDQVDWVSAGTQGKEESETISSKYPVIGVQRLITQFNMASGSTAVIGGLSRTVEEQRDSGIPYLSKIPWIGDVLFGGKQRHKTQKEIIVFVTVGLVDPRRMSKDAGLPKNAVLGRQYTEGKKLEPGDMPDEFLQGQNSIDTRSLEEQARQPIKSMPDGDDSTMFIPFINNKEK